MITWLHHGWSSYFSSNLVLRRVVSGAKLLPGFGRSAVWTTLALTIHVSYKPVNMHVNHAKLLSWHSMGCVCLTVKQWNTFYTKQQAVLICMFLLKVKYNLKKKKTTEFLGVTSLAVLELAL